MELMEAITSRRSTRKFNNTPVSREDIEYVLEAALNAPSAQNLQPWYFVVLTKPEDLSFVFSCLGTHAFSQRKLLEDRFKNNPEVIQETLEFERAMGGASTLVLAFQHKKYSSDSQFQNNVNESVAAACQNLVLAAHERGLASCWVNVVCLAGKELQEKFAPGRGELVSGIVLGHSDYEPKPIPRKADRFEIR